MNSIWELPRERMLLSEVVIMYEQNYMQLSNVKDLRGSYLTNKKKSVMYLITYLICFMLVKDVLFLIPHKNNRKHFNILKE